MRRALNWAVAFVMALTTAEAVKRISIPGTTTWQSMDAASCAPFKPTPSSLQDLYKTKFADRLSGIQASDITMYYNAAKCEQLANSSAGNASAPDSLFLSFEIAIVPAGDFNTKKDQVIAALRFFRDSNTERETLRKALVADGYPSRVAQIDMQMWECDVSCTPLTGTGSNHIVAFLGMNFTTIPPTTAVTTPEPAKCQFYMLWLFEDITLGCNIQAGVIFGGFGLLVICCPLMAYGCWRKKKQIEAMVCGNDSPTNLSTPGLESADLDGETKDHIQGEDDSQIPSASEDHTSNENSSKKKYATLAEKAYAKNCIQLSDGHGIVAAYHDQAEVEFYSIRNACWLIATLHTFVNEKKETSDPGSHQSPQTGTTCRPSYLETGGGKLNLGVELYLGEGHPLQWRYNVHLKQLRLPMSQGEDVEVWEKPDVFQLGKVEGPRIAFRQNSRQLLGYNVRLQHTGVLQRLVPAERIRRFFPIGMEVDHYAGPERGFVRAIVQPAKDPGGAAARDYGIQPWRVRLHAHGTTPNGAAPNGADPNRVSMGSAPAGAVGSIGTVGSAPAGAVGSIGTESTYEIQPVDSIDTNQPLPVETQQTHAGSPPDNTLSSNATNSTQRSNHKKHASNDSWAQAMQAMQAKGNGATTHNPNKNTEHDDEHADKAPLWTHVTIAFDKDLKIDESKSLTADVEKGNHNGELFTFDLVPSYLLRTRAKRRKTWL